MKKSISLLFFFLSLFGANETFAQCPTKVYVNTSIKTGQVLQLVNENQEWIGSISETQKSVSLSNPDKSKCKPNTKYSVRIVMDLYGCIYPCYHYGGDWLGCEADCKKKVEEDTPVILPLLGSKSEFDANTSANGYVDFK